MIYAINSKAKLLFEQTLQERTASDDKEFKRRERERKRNEERQRVKNK